ncbi:hypothetical protein BVX97_04400 [bacterium E08(2017)]|nr:hypothetical protein BVX97_04400 [bacterium E08(2017)]
MISTVQAIGTDPGDLHVVGRTERSGSAVSIVVRADYVAAPVIIEPDPTIKNKRKQIEAQREVAKQLVEAAKKNRSSLVVKFMGLAKEPYVYLMVPREKLSKDTSYYVTKIENLFKPIFFTGKSKCSLDSLVLAVKDPEKYRPEILKKIIYSLKELEVAIGSNVRAEISGLENSVMIQEYDDENVELYIPYQLMLELQPK